MEEKTLTAVIQVRRDGKNFLRTEPTHYERSNEYNGTEIANYLDRQVDVFKDKFPLSDLQIVVELIDVADSKNIKRKNIYISFEGTIEKPIDFMGLVRHSICAALRAMDNEANIEIK